MAELTCNCSSCKASNALKAADAVMKKELSDIKAPLIDELLRIMKGKSASEDPLALLLKLV